MCEIEITSPRLRKEMGSKYLKDYAPHGLCGNSVFSGC